MRDTVFRTLAAVLAVLILAVGGVVLFTDVRPVGSLIEALSMAGMAVLLFSTFTVMAVAGPAGAHKVLVRGMRLLGIVGDETVPERVEPLPGRRGEAETEGRLAKPGDEGIGAE